MPIVPPVYKTRTLLSFLWSTQVLKLLFLFRTVGIVEKSNPFGQSFWFALFGLFGGGPPLRLSLLETWLELVDSLLIVEPLLSKRTLFPSKLPCSLVCSHVETNASLLSLIEGWLSWVWVDSLEVTVVGDVFFFDLSPPRGNPNAFLLGLDMVAAKSFFQCPKNLFLFLYRSCAI